MSFPVIIEIVIGTAYTYLFFSLLASGLNEFWARWTDRRAKTLERAIPYLLGSADPPLPGLLEAICEYFKRRRNPPVEPPPPSLASAFCAHPLITGMATDYRFPSYIPPTNFALVLIDLAIEVTHPVGHTPPRASVRKDIEIPSKTAANPTHQLTPVESRIVESLIADETNIRVIQARIEKWFTDCGERISGSYKRASYSSLLVFSLSLSFLFGVDSIRLVKSLYTDPVKREQLVQQAQSATANTASQPPPIPIGWPTKQEATWLYVAGCLLTSLALSLGAPFWFDILNLFVNVRQTGDPPSSKSSITG